MEKAHNIFYSIVWKRKLSGPLPRECMWVQCIYEELAKYQKQSVDQSTKEDAIP
jgi:hypothetical protein